MSTHAQADTPWTTVAAETELPPGSRLRCTIDGLAIVLFNIDDALYAIEDLCSHEAEPLSNGELEGLEIICPLHFARFSLLDGRALTAPAYEPVATFPVRRRAGLIEIQTF